MAADKRPGVKQARKDSPKKQGSVATKKEHKQGWKLILEVFGLLMLVGATVIISQLIVGWTMIWILGAEALVQPVPTAVFSVLSYGLALVVLIFVTPKISAWWQAIWKKKSGSKKTATSDQLLKPTSREELGLAGLPTWTDVGLAPAGYIVYLLLAAVLMFVFSAFPWFDAGETQDVGFSTYIAGVDRLVAFLILVVVAPIVEEIIFRGWLYGKLRDKLSKETSKKLAVVLAALLVSVLFGLVHMQWNVGVNVFAMSLVLCALREFTGTIYAGILLHMLKNGLAFYLLYVVGFF